MEINSFPKRRALNLFFIIKHSSSKKKTAVKFFAATVFLAEELLAISC